MIDVTAAPLRVTSLDSRGAQRQIPASFALATVEYNVPAVVRVYLLQVTVQVSRPPTPRHDEDQIRHIRA